MDSFFGVRGIVACTAFAVGLAVFVFAHTTVPQAALAGFGYVVVRGLLSSFPWPGEL